jgi:hypothetical protein
MSDELNGPEDPENLVRDGLSGVAHPVPRDGGAGAVESWGGTEGSGHVPGGSSGEAGVANSAGGIAYRSDDDAGGRSSGTAEAEAKGLNAAAGPAAAQEAGTPDDRGLATDTSPSD